MTGWRGNDLGLVKWQVIFVHEQRLAMVSAVQAKFRDGAPFGAAKSDVIKAYHASWKVHPANVQVALQRVADDIRLADLGEWALRSVEENLIRDLGKRPTWLRRFLLRRTGLVW
jgi:hypothetical protein